MASSARIEELEKKFNENPRRYFAPLANEYRKAGETEQAIALCRAYLPQQPGHMSGHIVFGQALFDAGEIDEAQGVFETALTLDPENLIALRHLGDIAHSRGDIAGARGWYRRVLDADPRNEEIAAQLAALPDDGSAAATGSTPAADASSVGWGDINPERAGDQATAAAAQPEAGAPAAGPQADESGPSGADAPAAQPALASLEIERASASSDDDIDMDALFTTTDSAKAEPEPASPEVIALDGEKTAEVPVFDKAGDDEPTLEVAIDAKPSGVATDRAEPHDAEPAAAPADGLGLEVAEFVPPSATEPPERALGFETGHESVVGGPVDATPAGTPSTHGTPPGFVTETMAELYLQQGFMQEALNVYRQLLQQNPEDAALRERIEQLEHGARSSVSMAAVSDEVVEAARKRQSSPTRRSMRQFLGALAARRVPQREAADQPSEPSVELEFLDTGPADAGAQAEVAAERLPYEPEGAATEPPYEPVAAEAPFEPAEPEQPFASTAQPSTNDDGLDALFAGAGIDPDDQAAATKLARAFDSTTIPPTPSGPRGRPTRAAPAELSLDNVFRESGGDAGLQRPRSDFSFDQFFSDDASASGPDARGEERAESAEPPSPDDIGQFNDWLEGLKKK